MKKQTFSVTDELEVFQMEAPWTYISIPKAKVPDVEPGGWGSIPINVTIGKTTWRTSMFPIKKDNYFIPIKKSVRVKESVSAGETVTVKYTVA